MLALEVVPDAAFDPEVEGVEVDVTKVFEGDDAGDGLDGLNVGILPAVELDEVSVLVGLKTPEEGGDTDEEEDDSGNTPDNDDDDVGQHGIVVLVAPLVEKTPLYPEGKQLTVEAPDLS